MSTVLSPSAQKVQDTLIRLGFPYQVIELPQTTRSAAEAAQAVGCQVAQIAKSLVFKGKHSQRPILVITSGSNRVDEKKIAEFIAEPLGKADADFVRQHTGFAIGGVPPIGHLEPLAIFIDEDLLQYEAIWAAAGTPYAVFRLTAPDLISMTGGQVCCVKQMASNP
jgi:prolyl-tRNA editing enzyme YbaK/EbsC (Cys-tRNA(Pro) deacylase)